MMSTAAARPSTRALSDFLAQLDATCDAPILAAVKLIDEHRSAYATASKLSYMRHLAREAVYIAVSDDRAADAARARLDRAITSETDPTGAFRTALWPLLAAIVESGARLRREARAAELRRGGDLSHLSAEERAYHRELRAMFAARA